MRVVVTDAKRGIGTPTPEFNRGNISATRRAQIRIG
jgi:hypothetical protein